MKNKIKVVIVDDHLIVRRGLISLLENNDDIEVVGEGATGSDILPLVQQTNPDVLLTDLQMPAEAGSAVPFSPVEHLEFVLQNYPKLKVVVVTQEDDIQTIQSLAEIGVSGYVTKTDAFTASIGNAITFLYGGGTYFSSEALKAIENSTRTRATVELTPRQREILNCVVNNSHLPRDGQARLLNISVNTLYAHLHNIQDALAAPNIETCIVKAIRLDIVRPSRRVSNL